MCKCIVFINNNCIEDEVQCQIKELNFKTFRISTKRQDKNFEFTSQEVNEIVGAKVVQKYGKKVRLNKPDLNIIIELVNG